MTIADGVLRGAPVPGDFHFAWQRWAVSGAINGDLSIDGDLLLLLLYGA